MARRRRHIRYPRANHRNKAIYQLARRWAQRKSSGRFRGYAIGIRKTLRSKPKHVKRWAWSGRRGSVDLLKKGYLVASNPRRRSRSRGYSLRLNPAVGAVMRDYTSGLKAFPTNLGRLFKGKGMLIHTGVAIGGAAVALAGGSMLQRFTLPLLLKLPLVGASLSSPIGQRVVGAAHAWTAVFLVAKVAPIGADKKTALLTGGAAAVLTELVFPGKASHLLSKLPVIGGMLAPNVPSPVKGIEGLFGYVSAPGYQGVGEYVSAPGYQGVGDDQLAADDAIAGYVSAPNYQGVGELGQAMGSKMKSHLDG